MTHHLSGLDEAGYGPTLGPLVVGLVTLESAAELAPAAPWSLLAATVNRKRRPKRIAVADSKLLHRPSTGDLSPLEHGVLSFVACERGGAIPTTFRELIAHLTDGRGDYLDQYPWYQDRDLPLPVSVSKLELAGSIRRLARNLERAELTLSEVRALPLEVLEFNRDLAQHESKGEVNAQAMGRFLRWLWRKEERQHLQVFTDRLGGRTRYGPFLYPLFPGARFQILEQERAAQAYRASDDARDRSLTVHFNKGGEELCFPTALASMTAKYTRELHMRLFNEWWQMQDPDLKPTAGYPTDARRFLDDIEGLRKSLQIGPEALIRRR